MLVCLWFAILAMVTASPITPGKENAEQVTNEVKELESLRPKEEVSSHSTNQSNEQHSSPTQNNPGLIFRHRPVIPVKKNQLAAASLEPADVAAYVLQTGDEEGVAVVVEELVREGMMGRTDAINYLQDVKQILNYMREQMKPNIEVENKIFPSAQIDPKTTQEVPAKAKDDFPLDVIYQLAKNMFTQSIWRNDPTAEETLSGLVSFLEKEVGNQHISPAIKEKVLERVSAALVESLRESPNYQAFNQPMLHKLEREGPANVLQASSTNSRTTS